VPLLNGKDKAPDGAYCGYPDGVPNGYVKNWRTGQDFKWVATGHVLSPEQKAQMRAEHEQRRAAWAQERIGTQKKVAEETVALLASWEPASAEHPYLQKKGIPPLGDIKQSPDGKTLLIPLQNADGEIRSFQRINPDGDKWFQKGGQTKGCFCPLGVDNEAAKDTVLIAEGYATGVSLREATGLPVAVAGSSYNLEAVGQALREKYPDARLVFCADHDQKHGVGQAKAQEASQAVGGVVVLPAFTAAELETGKHKDFNDLHALHGLEAVKDAVSIGIEQDRSHHLAPDMGR
jgi:phage/plasmid primase-like uncharacterized protein